MKPDNRIIFMGTPDFAAYSLNELCKNGYIPVAVYTQPDKINGRGNKISYSPVKKIALEKNISIYQPETLKSETVLEELRSLRPDLIIVIAYGKILPLSVLDSATYGAINVHASLLPKYRGAAPIQRAIIDGCKKTGVTIMQLDAGMDTGNIISQLEVDIEPHMTAGNLFEKLAEKGSEALLDVLSHLTRSLSSAIPQDQGKATYAEKITKDMGCISWSESAEVLDCLIRGMYPNPGTYTFFRGKRLKIHQCSVEMIDTSAYEPGMIVSVSNGYIGVATGKGVLYLHEVQPENHKKMTALDFINGYQVKKNERFEF